MAVLRKNWKGRKKNSRAGPDCVSDDLDAAEHRKKTGLEREYPDQDKDVISLAREMQHMDGQLGDGATMQCIHSQLMEWGIPDMAEMGLQEQTPETPQCRE